MFLLLLHSLSRFLLEDGQLAVCVYLSGDNGIITDNTEQASSTEGKKSRAANSTENDFLCWF